MPHYLYRDNNGVFRIGSSLSNEFFIFTTGEGGGVVPVACTGSPSYVISPVGSGWPEIYYCNDFSLSEGTGYVQWAEPEETGDCQLYYQLASYYYSLMQPPPTGSYTQYNNGDLAVYTKSESPSAFGYNETYDYWIPGFLKFNSSPDNITQNTVAFSGLECGSEYSWAVRACNASGCSSWTDITWNNSIATSIGAFERTSDPVTSVTINTNYSTIEVDYDPYLCDNCIGSGTQIASPLISGFIYDNDTNELVATATAYQRGDTLIFSNPIPQGVSGLYYIEVTEDLYLYNGTSGNVICYNGRNPYCGRTLYYLEHI